MTHSPPHTLNFHNWLFTMKLQGTFETGEESKKTSAGYTKGVSQPWFLSDSQHKRRAASAWPMERHQQRWELGLLCSRETLWALRCFTASPANGAPGATKQTPQLHWGHFPLLQHVPHPDKLPWVTCSGHLMAKSPCSQQRALGSVGASQTAPQISKVAPNSYQDQKKSMLKSRESQVAVNNQKVMLRTQLFTFHILFLLVVFL